MDFVGLDFELGELLYGGCVDGTLYGVVTIIVDRTVQPCCIKGICSMSYFYSFLVVASWGVLSL